jgi:hypothetical protein
VDFLGAEGFINILYIDNYFILHPVSAVSIGVDKSKMVIIFSENHEGL